MIPVSWLNSLMLGGIVTSMSDMGFPDFLKRHRCGLGGRRGRFFFSGCASDSRERTDRIRLVAAETGRQQAPQQLSRGRASHHRPILAVVIGHGDVAVG